MLTENAQFFNGAFHLLDGSFYGSDIINNYIMYNKTMRGIMYYIIILFNPYNSLM